MCLAAHRVGAICVAFVLIAGGLAGWVFHYYRFFSLDFVNNVWGPAYHLLHGDSPYTILVFSTGTAAGWLPMIVGALFPVGAIDPYVASGFWVIFLLVTLLLLPHFLLERGYPSPGALLLSASFILAFPPTWAYLYLGQFTAVCSLALLLATRIMHRRLWLVALLIVITLIKPQVTLLAVFGLVIAIARNRGLRKTMLLGVFVGAWSAIMMLPLWVGYPMWMSDYLANMPGNELNVPVLWRELAFASNDSKFLFIWLSVAMLVGSINTLIWLKARPAVAASWSLALALLISPYLRRYDFVALIPLLLSTFFQLRYAASRVLLVLLLPPLLVLGIVQPQSVFVEFIWWPVPWLTIGWVVVVQAFDQSIANLGFLSAHDSASPAEQEAQPV